MELPAQSVVCDNRKGEWVVMILEQNLTGMYSFSCKGPSGNEGKTALL